MEWKYVIRSHQGEKLSHGHKREYSCRVPRRPTNYRCDYDNNVFDTILFSVDNFRNT